MINRERRRVAIVGAGVSGVTTAAHLKAEGLDVTVFERSSVAGGVWLVIELGSSRLEGSINPRTQGV